MNYRDALLLAAEDVGAAGTKVINIDINKPISQLEIKFQTTKSKASMDAGSPADIPKIELVDGSKVFYSLNGYCSQALGYYNRPSRLLDHGQHTNGNSQQDWYPIDFGRYLWDEMLAFDPQRFNNPQLKITFDEDVSDTGVTANSMEVWAKIFDEKSITPQGFLGGIEEYSYTCGANNSFETITLPEDRPYRQILVRAYQDAYEPWYSIDEARLDEGTLDRIPWDYTDLELYFRRMKSVWTPISYPFQGHGTSGGNVIYVPTTQYYTQFVGVQASGTGNPYVTVANGRGGKLTISAGSSIDVDGLVVGHLPWHCFQFPMGNPMDIGDWYNPSGKKPRLRLRASTGATSSTGTVVIEELFNY